MSGKMIVGMALGTALGMYIASKNRKVRQAVSEAETAVTDKICQMTGSCGQQSDSSQMQ